MFGLSGGYSRVSSILALEIEGFFFHFFFFRKFFFRVLREEKGNKRSQASDKARHAEKRARTSITGRCSYEYIHRFPYIPMVKSTSFTAASREYEVGWHTENDDFCYGKFADVILLIL